MTQEQLTELLTLSENIQDQISIAAELWGMSDFEETALCQATAVSVKSAGRQLFKFGVALKVTNCSIGW